MRIKAFILFITAFICLSGFSQTKLEGFVRDKQHNNALPYVNIGIIGKNVGTVSRSDGWFSIVLEDKYSEDSLRFSIIGYKSKTIKVNEVQKQFKNPAQIILEAEAIQLKEVVITSKGLKEAVLGNKTESKVMQAGFSSNELGNEVGLLIKIKKSPTYIENINISIVDNKYDTLKFRVNFYTMKNGLPYENILKQPIVVHTTLKKGKLSIDLRKYNIIVEENFFASLEWIEDLGENGLYFSASFNGSPIIARHTSQGIWEKVGPISLGISVGVKY